MIYIKITKFVRSNELEKDHSMIESRLKNAVIFFPNNFKFCAAKKNHE